MEDKTKKKLEKKTKAFMKNAIEFLTTKNGGELPPEWEASLMLLETYYFQFCQISEEIQNLDSIVIDSRYGPAPSPLLAIQTKISQRLEAMLKELGLTFHSAAKMKVCEPKKKKTALDKFFEDEESK